MPDEASYPRNADDPDQAVWFAELPEMLEADVDWNDCDIIAELHS